MKQNPCRRQGAPDRAGLACGAGALLAIFGQIVPVSGRLSTRESRFSGCESNRKRTTRGGPMEQPSWQAA